MSEEFDVETANNTLAELSADFHPEEVKQRTQAGVTLDYIDITSTIQRFNDVLGVEYDFVIVRSDVKLAGKDHKGRDQYLAQVQGQIHALGSIRSGVGADLALDPDKALKTAQAEAFKKAGHQFGVGLELWDPAVRAQIGLHRAAKAGDTSALKRLVVLKAQADGCTELNAAGLAAHFGVKEEALKDVEVLRDLAGLAA